VKLIKQTEKQCDFQMSKREKRLLFEILKLYPLIPTAHHRLSRTADAKAIEADQRLLEEALAEHKKANRKKLMALLTEENRFVANKDGYRFTLSMHLTDWLLQILNDIRVGSWVKLGCPDEKDGKQAELEDEDLYYYFAMEYCFLIQCALLSAFEPPS
jgi:hypothetical protein